MINENYFINMEAVKDLTKYLTDLRQRFCQSRGLTINKLADYTMLTPISLRNIENNSIKIPRLTTFMSLTGYWGFSDEQIIEIYHSFCDKNKKLRIVDENPTISQEVVNIRKSELTILPAFWNEKRNLYGFTLSKVSKITGIPQSTVSKLELGEINNTLSTLIPLCKLYEVQDDQVLSFYHRAVPIIKRDETINLDNLTKEELVNIIIENKVQPDKYYSRNIIKENQKNLKKR